MHLSCRLLPLLPLLILCTLIQRSQCAGPDTPASPNSGFQTARTASVSSSPPTPEPPARADPPASRIVYDDEDPHAARMAWLQGRMEEKASGGKMRYIEGPLKHPSANFAEKKEAPEVFTFGAMKEATEVPVEPVAGSLEGEESRRERMRKKLVFGSPPPGAVGARGRRRFNEGALRRGGRGERGDLGVREPASAFDVASASVGGRDAALRPTSPTRLALDTAAAKLASLQGNLRQQQLQREQDIQRLPPDRFSLPSTPPHEPSSGSYVSAPTHQRSAVSRTPPSGAISDAHTDTPPYRSVRDRSSAPSTPPSGPPVQRAPYRMWNARTALPSIGIDGVSSLSQVPREDYHHWGMTVRELGTHDWFQQLTNRVLWAARARQTSTRPGRTVTSLGIVTGGDVETGNPEFIHDPSDPMPRLDSVEVSELQKKIHAWHEFATLLPPALTAHSQAVYASHAAYNYANIDKSIHDAVHPVQYISQMLRDNNAAVILENSIHGDLHRSTHMFPPDVSKLSNGKGTALEDVLGTQWAQHNSFWPHFYRGKEPMEIKHPSKVGLDAYGAFRQFKDAVAFREV